MEVILAFVVGGLYAAAVYMLLRRSIVKLLIGLALLGQASCLLIFTTSGLSRSPAIIAAGQQALVEGDADPLPQALILTAIVIGFGLLAFAVALTFRTYKVLGTEDMDRMRSTDT